MPDLSEMLGAVYGGTDEPAAAAPEPNHEWADDDQLDRAFAEWTPGPGADAPAAERSMFAAAPEAPARLADDLAAALSEAVLAEADPVDDSPVFEPRSTDDDEDDVMAETVTLSSSSLADLEPEPEPEAEPAPIPMPLHKAGWQRSDDDIIPTGRSGRGRGLSAPRPSLGRRPKATKPGKPAKADKGPKAPKAEKAPKADKPKGKGLKREINFSFGKKK